MPFIRSIAKAHRVWLSFVLAMAFVMASIVASYSQDAATTIYIVRHAEKRDASPDSLLAPKGQERAKELAHVLRDAGLTAIYVSNRERTRQTAEPIARMMKIEPVPLGSSAEIVKEILNKHVGGHILVVGHSDTVNKIAAGLGTTGVAELGPNQFDRVFLVQLVGTRAYLNILRYGEPTD